MDHHKLFPTKSLQSQKPPNTTNPSSNIKVSESLGSRVVIFGVLTHDSKGSESLGSRMVIFGVLTHDPKGSESLDSRIVVFGVLTHGSVLVSKSSQPIRLTCTYNKLCRLLAHQATGL